MRRIINIRFTALVFVLFASVILILPHSVFGASASFARSQGSARGTVAGSSASVGPQVSQATSRFRVAAGSQPRGSNRRVSFSSKLAEPQIILVDDALNDQLSVSVQQIQLSPGPRQPAKKRVYKPERWVETEHGVLVFEPEHWVEVETEAK